MLKDTFSFADKGSCIGRFMRQIMHHVNDLLLTMLGVSRICAQ